MQLNQSESIFYYMTSTLLEVSVARLKEWFSDNEHGLHINDMFYLDHSEPGEDHWRIAAENIDTVINGLALNVNFNFSRVRDLYYADVDKESPYHQIGSLSSRRSHYSALPPEGAGDMDGKREDHDRFVKVQNGSQNAFLINKSIDQYQQDGVGDLIVMSISFNQVRTLNARANKFTFTHYPDFSYDDLKINIRRNGFSMLSECAYESQSFQNACLSFQKLAKGILPDDEVHEIIFRVIESTQEIWEPKSKTLDFAQLYHQMMRQFDMFKFFERYDLIDSLEYFIDPFDKSKNKITLTYHDGTQAVYLDDPHKSTSNGFEVDPPDQLIHNLIHKHIEDTGAWFGVAYRHQYTNEPAPTENSKLSA